MNRLLSIKKKLNKRSAFTLAETLVAILILLMVSSVVAAGIPAAKNAYERVVMVSNAEMLMSTTVSAFRNELGMSSKITIGDSDTSISYYNEINKTQSKIFKDGDVIKYQMYAGGELSMNPSDAIRLVSSPTATDGMDVTYGTIKKDTNKGIVTIKNLVVKKGSKEVTEKRDISIRVIFGMD